MAGPHGREAYFLFNEQYNLTNTIFHYLTTIY